MSQGDLTDERAAHTGCPGHPATDVPSGNLQAEVQRLLGSCVMRLQRYESLAKALLTQHELAGPPGELEAIRAAKIERVAKTGLGCTIKQLQESYLSPPEERPDLLARYEARGVFAFAFRASFSLDEAEIRQTALALGELVAMRNDLVHRLVEMFDLSSIEGCLDARAHLERCIAQIDDHLRQLQTWVDAFNHGRTAVAAFVQSQEFKDALRQAMSPESISDWRDTTVVAALRSAFRTCELDGWAKLTDAVALIATRHPVETPERYGFRGWRHLLHECRLFELRRRPGAAGGSEHWYRERARRS